MATNTVNTTTISRGDGGFPAYLNFTRLREASIEYLGELSGKIWTDHNLHDPGITTLEMLCYALLDLGYRTQFPAADIFARNPAEKGRDDNFWTPSEMLTCNSVTIIDFRKLLSDIDGIRNAWLYPASDVADICKKTDEEDPAIEPNVRRLKKSQSCANFLNGLYHVYIELEEQKTDPVEKKQYEDAMLDKVRSTLMAHRNLGEDFEDITILCKQDLGICADIELELNADVKEVYPLMVKALQDFMDPAPHFYTLPELLDKGRSVEEAFEGRPYQLNTLHGFIDTIELGEIELKKEIHLSDVFQLLTAIPGIKTVRRLQLQSCGFNKKLPAGTWKYQLPHNTIPVFSVDCSTIHFTQSGKDVQADFTRLNQYLSLQLSDNSKLPLTGNAAYLDMGIPAGLYQEHLGEYYSVQNEFPRVYGIGEGGLPADAPVARRAQALQFKGYLLFFDQLLANYLSQLQNIRTLFSASPPATGEVQTYFSQKPGAVPDIDKLLRFGQGEASSTAASVKMLVMPVNRKDLLKALTLSVISRADMEKIQVPFYFSSDAVLDIAIALCRERFEAGSVKPVVIDAGSDSAWYYADAGASDWVLLSHSFCADDDIKTESESIQYLATSMSNYSRRLSPDGSQHTFIIDDASSGYLGFLRTTTETKTVALERRNAFLDHLLSRFSERFSDFALLSYSNGDVQTQQQLMVEGKQAFLSRYAELSSNRGRAMDYLTSSLNAGNTSGFQQRLTALAGFKNCNPPALCNFVVEKFDEQFLIQLKVNNENWFSSEHFYYAEEQAALSARSLLQALQSWHAYETWLDENTGRYQLRIHFDEGQVAVYKLADTASAAEMNTIKRQVFRQFSRKAESEDIVTSQTIFRFVLERNGTELFRSKEFYSNSEVAERAWQSKQPAERTNPEIWEAVAAAVSFPKKYYVDQREPLLRILDLEGFKIIVSNRVLGRPDVFQFEVLDKSNYFKIESGDEFGSSLEAETAAGQLLADLSVPSRFQMMAGSSENTFLLHTEAGTGMPAQTATLTVPAGTIDRAIAVVRDYVLAHLYEQATKEKDFRFRFNFPLAGPGGVIFQFESVNEFEQPELAKAAANAFYEELPGVELNQTAAGVFLVKKNAKTPEKRCKLTSGGELANMKGAVNEVSQLLAVKKQLLAFPLNAEAAQYKSFTSNDVGDKEKQWVFRLLEKDQFPARYTGDKNHQQSEAAANEKKRSLFQHCSVYEHLDICLGGDIFCVRVDQYTGQLWYHFEIRIKTQGLPGKEFVLFESVCGYGSEEEAQAAFDAVYVKLLNLATDSSQYGPTGSISLEERIVHGPADPKIKAIVFIALEARQSLNAYNDTQLISKIVALARKYPIHELTNDCADRKEWEERFPCLPVPDSNSVDCSGCSPCTAADQINKYYFFVLSDKDGNESWQSTMLFPSPAEARNAFQAFRPLLCLPGNYFVNIDLCACVEDEKKNCRCNWAIYIREVLAESTARFETPDAAWEAVESFICLSQTPGAFHRYLDKKECAFSFFTACQQQKLVHPCTYYSARKRDRALSKLFKLAKQYLSGTGIAYFNVQDPSHVYDRDGQVIATFSTGDNQPDNAQVLCENFIGLADALAAGAAFREDSNGFSLIDPAGNSIVAGNATMLSFAQWQDAIAEAAWFFPVVSETDASGIRRFLVEIQLPPFNDPRAGEADRQKCDCDGKPVSVPTDCYCAWKSDCSFADCAAAFVFYLLQVPSLLQYKNYRAVLACDCGEYGIEIVRDEDIAAHNPQHYHTIKDVCDATEKAICLINSEGFHLVEHILLRPRCEADCNCELPKENCAEPTHCSFEWTSGDQEDPCNKQKTICFAPGEDPYSFIATVALPIWSARMNKLENRKIIEDLLCREAPAHVLLRILWLRPRDMFQFEVHYKQWQHWLGWKNNCDPKYSECSFLQFLFTTSFGCMTPCSECLPCQEAIMPRNNCFDEPCDALVEPAPYTFLNQVNDLYCWTRYDCNPKQNYEANKQPVTALFLEDQPKQAAEMAMVAEETEAPNSTVMPKKAVVSEKMEVGEPAGEAAAPRAVTDAVTGADELERRIDQRFASYRKAVDQLLKRVDKHTIVREVQGFLKAYKPPVKSLATILTMILRNEKPKGRTTKKLSKPQQRILVKSAIFYCFDNVLIYQQALQRPALLAPIFAELHNDKLLPDRGAWNVKELDTVASEDAMNAINQLFK